MSEAATLAATVAVAVVGVGRVGCVVDGRGRIRGRIRGLHVDTADHVVAMVRAQLAEMQAENVRLREQMVADAAACEERVPSR